MDQQKRIEFNGILVDLLAEEIGDSLAQKSVFFQPYMTAQLTYPCIIYNFEDVQQKRADDRSYFLMPRYSVKYITQDVDHQAMIERILSTFPYSSLDRTYVTDKLYHTVFTIYY